MVENKRSTRPAVDSNGNKVATLSWIARHINERFPPKGQRRPVSRQYLHKSWKNRSSNRFPESTASAASAGGEGRPMFRVGEVVDWYVDKRWYRIGDVIPLKVTEEHDDNSGNDALAA